MPPRALPFVVLWACLAPAAAQQFRGAGGCSGASCHGRTSAAPEAQSRIPANEYSVWAVRDKHANAYKALADDRSRRMAETLKLGPAERAPRCLSCHAAGSPPDQISDGVSCEGCHSAGPTVAKWLGPHSAAGVTHAANVANGMYDTKDLTLRAKKCLECHIGTADKVVDHELIAAGHPDLVFELDTFGAAQPAHWRPPKPQAGNSLPGVREWAVGQAVALGEGMRLLAARTATSWPEFAELECYQCHHDLRAESWRIQRGYGGRKPGSLQANLARQEVLRILAAQAAKEQAGALDGALRQLATVIATRLGDGAGIAKAAQAAAGQADALAARFAKQDFDSGTARALVKALSGDAARLAGSGVQTAEQATMALDALGAAAWPGNQGFQALIAKLYDYLEHPSAYQPAEFAGLFRKAAALLN